MAEQSFLPVYRLRKTDEYSSVFAFRRVIRGRYFTCHYRPAEGQSARLGVVVAKKLVRRAVVRNMIKRIAREQFRLCRSGLPRHDLIIRVTSKVAGVSRAQLREEILQLLARLPK